MKLGADWITSTLDAQDYEMDEAELVLISEIVPGDTIEADDREAFVVDNISLIRVRSAQQTVRRYLIEPEDGEPFQLSTRRLVRKF